MIRTTSARFDLRLWAIRTWLTLCLAVVIAAGLHAGARAAEVAGLLPHKDLAFFTALKGPLPPARIQKLVWEGADIDGDGAPDFANPTGKPMRTHDAYGEGEFGASRDGGARRHEGVDYDAAPGQKVVAPISGFVSKIGYAYAGDTDLKFVEVSNPALGYVARVFYVDPTVEVGQAVRVGTMVGTAHSLQAKYPDGMTNHVHTELSGPGHHNLDATRLITARLETETVAGD
jgi:murein DD-endopeptidase MepM/ murein hydrolase activator NlpD